MFSFNTLLPFASGIISTIFAVLVFWRYANHKRTGRRAAHLLLWGIGMVFYAIGGFCEASYGAFGWNALIFRLWYLCGAILVTAWLGQGTVYLLGKRKWANVLMIVLAVASLYAGIRVFGAQLDPSLMTESVHTGSELSGGAIVTGGIRRPLTPLFNTYGTVMLVVAPSFTVKMVPVRAFSGWPPSAGGLLRGSRQVPVQVGGSWGSLLFGKS